MGGKGGHGHTPLAGRSEATGMATVHGWKGSPSPGKWDGATAPHRTPSPVGAPGAGVTQGMFYGGLHAVVLSSRGLSVPQTPAPSGHGPLRGQLHVPHLLLVAAVEEGVLLGGEVAAPVPHHPCGTAGMSQGCCTRAPHPPSPIPPHLCA